MLIVAAFAVPAVVLIALAAYQYWPRAAPPPLAAPREPLLPDLTMPPLTDLIVGRRENGGLVLFFTATIANTGRGPLLIHAVRGDERSRWRVGQRFVEQDGSMSEQVTPANLRWGGHGHNHWHVELGASYQLDRIGGTTADVRRFKKQGFCFFDQLPFDLSLPGAPKAQHILKTTCDGFHRLEIDMGISVGWRDPYQWTLPDQRLPIVGLGNGTYRLTATADPDGWFRETDERNNSAWVEFQLTTTVDPPRVRVVRTKAPPSHA